MFLKIMSGEDLPDNDGSKMYRLIECKDVQFYRHGFNDGDGPVASVGYAAGGPGDTFALTGNAYVLNNAGKTVDSFWAFAKAS